MPDATPCEVTAVVEHAEADHDEDEAAWSSGRQAEAEARQVDGAALIDAGLRLYSMLDGQWHSVFVEAFNERSGRHRVHYPDGTQLWHLLRDERWVQTSAPADRPLPSNAHRSSADRRRPRRAAGEAASRATARVAAQEELAATGERLHEEDDHAAADGAEARVDEHGRDDTGDPESAAGAESGEAARRPPSKRGRGAASGGRAPAKRSRARDIPGPHPRPPGRATSGRHWDGTLGEWVVTAQADGGGPEAAASATGLLADGEAPPACNPSGGTFALRLAPDGISPSGGTRWEEAGPELPGWVVERRVAATGRQYAVYHGPQGLRANSRVQALQGGVRRGTLQKPMEEMTVRELICERTQGVPMRAARVIRSRRRRSAADEAEAAQPSGAAGEEGGGVPADAPRGAMPYPLDGGRDGRSFVIPQDAAEAEELRQMREAAEEEARGPVLAADEEDGADGADGGTGGGGASGGASGGSRRLRRGDSSAEHGDVGAEFGRAGDEWGEYGGEEGWGEEAEEEEEEEEEEAGAGGDGAFIPQLKMVDGQIVFDEATLQVTAQPSEAANLATMVEEDTGQGVTSASYLNRAPSLPWTPEETKAFLAALQKYGTDFSLIAALFPNRNRRQIKNKFKREEKEDPRRMDLLLSGRPLDEVPAATPRLSYRAALSSTAPAADADPPPRALLAVVAPPTGAAGAAGSSSAGMGRGPLSVPASTAFSAISAPSARHPHQQPAIGAAAPPGAAASLPPPASCGTVGLPRTALSTPALRAPHPTPAPRVAPTPRHPSVPPPGMPRLDGPRNAPRPAVASAPPPAALPPRPAVAPSRPVASAAAPIAPTAPGRAATSSTAAAGAASSARLPNSAAPAAAASPAAATAASRRPMLSSMMVMMSRRQVDEDEEPEADVELPPEPEEWEYGGGGSEDEDNAYEY